MNLKTIHKTAQMKAFKNTGKRLLPFIITVSLFSYQTEAKTDIRLNDTVRIGMNAIDHVLQKPLPLPKFGDDSPSRFFMSFGGGVALTGRSVRPGLLGEFSLGSWITPVHGWRLSLSTGVQSVNKGEKYPYYGSASVDYLMNFSSLLRGYDPTRKFELLGAVGLEYERMRIDGTWGNEFGARAALQARFNVSRSLYLYAEPRLALLHGRHFGPDNFRRFRPVMSFNVGMGYRLLSKKERHNRSSKFFNTDDSNLFFSAGGGATFASGHSNDYGPTFAVNVGKWLSEVSALRLNADFCHFDRDSKGKRRDLATAGLDYVWNICSAFGGYRPDDIFGLNLNVGMAMAYANNASDKFYPGVQASVTASFRLSPNWKLFIEPEVSYFGSNFRRDLFGNSARRPMASISAGLTYTIGEFFHNHPNSYEDYLKDGHYFLTFMAAPTHRLRGDKGNGFAAAVGFGKRFTPVSSWRITVDGELMDQARSNASLGIGADYLSSISTAMAGYNPDRLFDLSGVIGFTIGASATKGSFDAALAGKAGIHGAFRLNDALSLYLEPQMLAVRRFGDSREWTPEGRLMIGLTYRPGRYAGDKTSSVKGDGRNFVSLSAGPSLNIRDFASGYKSVNGAADIAIGRRFTLVSGARLGASFDFVPSDRLSGKMTMTTIHADYMLNVTSLINRDQERRFHIIGIAGAGISFSDTDDSQAAPAFDGGVQFRYSLPCGIDLHIEPNAVATLNKVAPSYGSRSKMIVFGRVMAGASIRF